MVSARCLRRTEDDCLKVVNRVSFTGSKSVSAILYPTIKFLCTLKETTLESWRDLRWALIVLILDVDAAKCELLNLEISMETVKLQSDAC